MVAAAGLADTALVSLAVLGVSVVVLRVPWVETALFGVGAAFLVVVGYSFLRWPALAVDPETESHLGVREQVAFAAGVSLLNPHAIVDTVGVIGTSALAYDGRARLAFAAATIAVSWTWFGGLATAGRLLGDAAAAERYLRHLNVASAVVVWAVAAYMGWRFLRTLGVG
jgi:L-lysine exporter family protein LysE/ArgO